MLREQSCWLAAKDNNVPFYVALPSSTFDWTLRDGIKEIPIEERDPYEIRYIQGKENGKIKRIVTEDMVAHMQPGSVIIDVSIDRGGCIETSEPRTQIDPVFVKHGVMHYCVPNIPSRVARTASIAISNRLSMSQASRVSSFS